LDETLACLFEGTAGMMRCSRLVATLQSWLLFAVCLLFGACHGSSSNSAPVVIFDKVPRSDVGGPDKLDTIEGHVSAVRAGQQIVLYAKSQQLWWIQPFSEKPYTTIHADARWTNQTHLGTEYAALLINQGFKPPRTTETLPTVGASVAAVAVVKGQGEVPAPSPTKVLHFSGYDWIVRSGGSYRGGSFVPFVSENAWTDDKGALHLRMSHREIDWGCAEVKLARSLGYGTYRFTVRDISHLEPEAVLTLFTWDGVGTEDNRRELDFEFSRWGFQENDNAQYVVQPYYIPLNIVRFRAPAGVLTQSLRWEPGRATFTTSAGSGDGAEQRVIYKHVFTAGVPAAGGENARINYYAFLKGQVPLKNDSEVIIDKFEYLP
jgi:hypothetical protein